MHAVHTETIRSISYVGKLDTCQANNVLRTTKYSVRFHLLRFVPSASKGAERTQDEQHSKQRLLHIV